jgi:hypothetical protein
MRHLHAVAVVGLAFLASASHLRAEVPPDLTEAAKFQQRNKASLIQKLQQRAALLRQQGNAEAAKAVAADIDAVRANKLLVLPPLGEASNDIGTINVEQVLDRADGGMLVQTSLPRIENTSVNVNTGRAGRSPANMGLVYYPEKLLVMTNRGLAAGQTINVRRCEGGVAEIPSSEIEAAASLLKKK